MPQQQQKFPKAQSLCTITIEYDDSIRSIDLENILSSFRMLCQYELAEKTGQSPRDFTSAVRIQSIEKGSIIIHIIVEHIFNTANVVLDTYGNNNDTLSSLLDIADYIHTLYELYQKEEIKDMCKTYYKKFVSAALNVRAIVIKGKNHTTELKSDSNGNVDVTLEDNNSTHKD